MLKNIFVVVLMVIFLISCQAGKEEAKKFSADFTQTVDTFREKRAEVKTRDEYIAYKEERKKEFEALLKKYEESPAIEEIEILRSKALLQLGELDKAEAKIDGVLAEGPENVSEAKMVKVNILIKREKYSEAYTIFKDIETEIKDPDDLYNAYYYIGQEYDDNKVKKDYSRKFLNAQDIPENFKKSRYQMFGNLASIAMVEGDPDKARTILNEGIADTQDERQKVSLEKRLAQLDFIGQSAYPLSTKTWLNSSYQDIKQLKGKAVILFFWATWCPYCRSMYPLLLEAYDEYTERGLIVIGVTRLYGRYRDDMDDKGKVDRDEELDLIKKYLERKTILIPNIVADDKADFDSYKISGLPTMVFIDKQGNIDFFKIGSGDNAFIKEKIRKLVEEEV
jgi:thiol-disulfide isomerase/thioredoxin/Flp pilus assembly protein TadD